ncbi:hypothetical protein FH972_018799 [Carpinus fangiana]|uniref:Uncharacterized protein n=1 Tax=Carpinus fangiana TaxID=176857 RepID=A0A5N6RRH7_9ROSI|nr:hypothetical protein FH972_018799 [Carpinus fangiana]
MTLSYPPGTGGSELDNIPKECSTLVQGGEDFVTDGDAVDLGLGVKWQNVIGDPGLGGGEFGQGGNIAVSNGDGHGDAGVEENAEDVGVGVKYLNAVDGGLGFEKGGNFGRWWPGGRLLATVP